MKVSAKDVFSPANGASAVGLTLTIIGSLNITTLTGVLILGLGRFLDVFDGKIARATHTSRLGAIVDATCDKIGIAVLVPAAWFGEIAPYWLLIYIGLQNIANVLITAVASKRGAQTISSRYGKHALFVQNISLGSFALGTTTDLSAFTWLGYILGIASVFWGVKATYGYFTDIPSKASA